MSYTLVLIRHGESEWNKANLFTGWTDVELSENGVQEAVTAGKKLKEEGFSFDICYTSYLKRAIHTANNVLAQLDEEWIPMVKDGRLNERHYGALQGLNKADTAAKYGVYFVPGDHERIAGWMQCQYRLQFDEHGYARCYIFENCTGFIRTIPLMMYDEHKVEDLDTSMEDHIADEWRYMCMNRPVQPLRPVETVTILNDPLNQFTNR